MRSARKHIGWYVRALPGGEDFRQRMNEIADAQHQHQAVADYLDELATQMDRLPEPTGQDLTQDDEMTSAV